MAIAFRNTNWRLGALIGLVLTGLGAAAFQSGRLDLLAQSSLDMHVRAAKVRPVDDRIALIDIDDASLETVGDWPWPRRRYAQLVRALSHAGAKAIVLDVVLTDPAAPRTVHADLGADYDVESAMSLRGSRATDEIVFDDDELRDAIRQAGNVYLAMYCPLVVDALTPDERVDHALAWLHESPSMTLPAMRARCRRDATWKGPMPDDVTLVRATLVSRLLKRFDLDLDEAVTQLAPLGVDRDAVTLAWRKAKECAARRLSQDEWDQSADGHDPSDGSRWTAFVQRILGDEALDARSPDRTVLLRAFRRAGSARAINGLDVAPAKDQAFPSAYDETLPLDKFASAARDIGFVTHTREAGDGVVRTLPFLARAGDRWYAQLGFAVGCDERGLERAAVESGSGRLELSGAGGRLGIPLSADGQTVIAWHAPAQGDDWRDSFHHWSAAYVLQATLAREAIEQNEKRIGLAKGALLEARYHETPSELARYEQIANEWWRFRRAEIRDPARPSARTPVQVQRYRKLQAEVTEMEREAFVWLERLNRLWRDEKPQTEAERKQRDAVTRWYAELVDGDMLSRLERLNQAAAAQSATADAALRDKVAGKICIVGYTASSVADLVTTPVYSSVPGVMAHANVLNMVLGNQFVTVLPTSVQLVVMGVLGALISVVTARTGSLVSLLVGVLLAAFVLASGVLLFCAGQRHVDTLPIIAVLGVTWTVVAVYCQFTEEHVRRSIERALSQYTSPAIASRVSQDANLRRLAPQPAQVTCFFSDLEGFTRLSERLGPARTRDVLNPYLETMSAVLMEHGAIVNKFIGDGIFAFFNAPIRPCADHPRSACDAAMACHAALTALNRDSLAGHALRMRIGIAGGEVFVGDYGSDSKLDYTCIGDCVNVAARLEKANKVLGTSTLVDGATAAAHPSGRPIGRWRVSGRDGPVELVELRSMADASDRRDAADIWNTVIATFQARQWASCRAAIDQYLIESAGDSVANAYLRAIAQFEIASPGDDWDGAIDIPLV